jgi:glutamyl-tRNA synthetase
VNVGGPAVGRLAPSPTGVLHLGNARTFLWAWLAARSRGGRVVLRIEDLEKPLAGYVLEEMLSDLRWLGFEWDEGPVWTEDDDVLLAEQKRFPRAKAIAAARCCELGAAAPPAGTWLSALGRHLPFTGPHAPYIQSLRAPLYRELFERLLSGGWLYPCTCERADFAGNLGAPHDGEAEPRYPGTCRGRWTSAEAARAWLESRPRDREAATNAPVVRSGEPVWRFRVPEGEGAVAAFEDALRGRLSIDVAASVGDFVAFKHPGLPAYQLAVVADDLAMGVNQVVRGDDLIPSTARQVLVYRALATLDGRAAPDLPFYGHAPLVVGADGQRVAKRHGDARLRSLRQRGVDPRAVLGALAAWSGLGDGRPVALADLLPRFDWARLNRERLVIDQARLDGIG